MTSILRRDFFKEGRLRAAEGGAKFFVKFARKDLSGYNNVNNNKEP